MSFRCQPARRMQRPMRPNTLIATRTDMGGYPRVGGVTYPLRGSAADRWPLPAGHAIPRAALPARTPDPVARAEVSLALLVQNAPLGDDPIAAVAAHLGLSRERIRAAQL